MGQTARLCLHLAWTVKGVAANDECAGVVLCCHRGFTVMTFDNKHHQEISRNNCKLRERGKEGGRQSVAVASGEGRLNKCGVWRETAELPTHMIGLTGVSRKEGPRNLEMIVLNGRKRDPLQFTIYLG